jgi:hypothetical protein
MSRLSMAVESDGKFSGSLFLMLWRQSYKLPNPLT